MNKVIIADASPLIAFGSIDKLSIIFKLFSKVVITQTVADECVADMGRPGAIAIAKVIAAQKIQIHASVALKDCAEILAILDQGEADAIALAHTLNLPLVIDEKLGRSIAKALGIKIIGTVGILLLAKQKGIIKHIKPNLQELKNGHYFLSDVLIKDVLRRAGER